MEEISAQELYCRLLKNNVQDSTGCIQFSMNALSVIINTSDIVGNCIQSWLKKWMISNDIYCSELKNTQTFPDFYLSTDITKSLLEIKAFNYNATPAFDIANFEAYCASLRTKAYRLHTDYLIFGYTMNEGIVRINKIWLKKIWEISGASARYALNTQIKRNVIYNIRPVSNFKFDRPPVFNSKEEFLNAVYLTLKQYRGDDIADSWRVDVIKNYYLHMKQILSF